MIYGITDITAFVVGTIVIVLLPGPNSLYVMTVASRWGIAAGYRGACGIFVGDLVLMVLSASGVASLLRTTPALFMVIKYAGAAYLAWLGLGLIRAGWVRWRERPSAEAAAAAADTVAPVDASHPFRTALGISLMNPKAILFFVSFFIQFVDPDYPHPALTFVILGIIVQICSAAYLSLLIFGGVHLAAQFRRHPRVAAPGMAVVGLMFVGFGLRLLNASLS